MKNNTYIISLGGSLIVPPSGIDWKFLKEFKKLILSEVKLGKKFFIIAGGGNTCRVYNEALYKITKPSAKNLDWLGIQACALNAELFRIVFNDMAFSKVIKPDENIKTNKKIIIGGGWKPGRSSDYGTTKIAEINKIKNIINLSNFDYVCDKDPKKHKNTKIIKEINWKNFQKIVGTKYAPGASWPFDPIATKNAKKLNLNVAILNGKNLPNLKNFLNNKEFKGTLIS
jgi:uridylate kinase